MSANWWESSHRCVPGEGDSRLPALLWPPLQVQPPETPRDFLWIFLGTPFFVEGLVEGLDLKRLSWTSRQVGDPDVSARQVGGLRVSPTHTSAESASARPRCRAVWPGPLET